MIILTIAMLLIIAGILNIYWAIKKWLNPYSNLYSKKHYIIMAIIDIYVAMSLI